MDCEVGGEFGDVALFCVGSWVDEDCLRGGGGFGEGIYSGLYCFVGTGDSCFGIDDDCSGGGSRSIV